MTGVPDHSARAAAEVLNSCTKWKGSSYSTKIWGGQCSWWAAQVRWAVQMVSDATR